MKLIRICLIALSLLASCAVRETMVPLEAKDEFERALSYYETKKYDRAIEAFERVLFYHPSSEYVDDAQYWLGRTYLERKESDQAIVEFDYLIRHFPNSPKLEDALFYRAKAHLASAPDYEKDLSGLSRAIQSFDEFLTRFPNSAYTDDVKKEILSARNRLARKELENGKLYEKLKEPQAALLYYQHVIETYPETESASDARYRAALIHEHGGRFQEAIEMYEGLLEDEKWKEDAAKRIADLKKRAPEPIEQ